MASFDDEYALFKLEIEGIDNLSDSKNDPNQEEGSNEMTDNLDTKGSGHEENATEVAPESILVPDIDNELNYLKGEYLSRYTVHLSLCYTFSPTFTLDRLYTTIYKNKLSIWH